MLHPLICQAT